VARKDQNPRLSLSRLGGAGEKNAFARRLIRVHPCSSVVVFLFIRSVSSGFRIPNSEFWRCAKWIKFIFAVLLLPVCGGAARALWLVLRASGGADVVWVPLLAGAACWS